MDMQEKNVTPRPSDGGAHPAAGAGLATGAGGSGAGGSGATPGTVPGTAAGTVPGTAAGSVPGAGAITGSTGGSGSGRELSLEDIIQLANKIGLEFVDKRREAERLELLRTSVRSKIMNRLESDTPEGQPAIPETRLKRLAEADAEYMALLEQIAQARADSEKLRIRYESYRNLFDARRTMISYKKTELKSL